MTTDATGRPSTLVLLQVVMIVAGIALVIAATAIHQPWLPLAAGPCFIVSGLLLALGVRATFAGRVGDVLRMALGPTRVAGVQLRAAIWIVIGVALTAWGVYELRAGMDASPPFWQEPVARTPDARG